MRMLGVIPVACVHRGNHNTYALRPQHIALSAAPPLPLQHLCVPLPLVLPAVRLVGVTQFAGFRFHRSREGGVMLDEYLGLWRSW